MDCVKNTNSKVYVLWKEEKKKENNVIPHPAVAVWRRKVSPLSRKHTAKLSALQKRKWIIVYRVSHKYDYTFKINVQKNVAIFLNLPVLLHLTVGLTLRKVCPKSVWNTHCKVCKLWKLEKKEKNNVLLYLTEKLKPGWKASQASIVNTTGTPFLKSSSILALKILHFMFSSGMAEAPPVNLIWLFWKVFTSLRFTGTGMDSSKFFILLMAFSLSSENKGKCSKWLKNR